MPVTVWLLSAAVGLVLGLVGGGGSILMVPILVSSGIEPRLAIAMSLPVVGLTALAGAVVQHRAGYVHSRAVGIFAVFGFPGALLGARFTALVPAAWLLIAFAILLLVVGGKMLIQHLRADENADSQCDPRRCAIAGVGLGLLTGFLGVGGGFLLVPALRRYARLDMKAAAGTSLAIIAVNSAAGFLGHVTQIRGHEMMTAGVAAAAMVGLGIGVSLGRRTSPRQLQRAFGAVAVAVAAYMFLFQIR